MLILLEIKILETQYSTAYYRNHSQFIFKPAHKRSTTSSYPLPLSREKESVHLYVIPFALLKLTIVGTGFRHSTCLIQGVLLISKPSITLNFPTTQLAADFQWDNKLSDQHTGLSSVSSSTTKPPKRQRFAHVGCFQNISWLYASDLLPSTTNPQP